MFYDIFLNLCQGRGISSYKALKEMGVGMSTATRWKQGTAQPSYKTLQKIADYFGVSVDELLADDDYKDPKPVQQGEILHDKVSLLCKQKGITFEDMLQALPADIRNSLKLKTAIKRQSHLNRISDYFGVDREYLYEYSPIFPVPGTKKETAEIIDSPEEAERRQLLRQAMEMASTLSDDKLRRLIEILKSK